LNEINDKILKDKKWDASNISPQMRNQKVSRKEAISDIQFLLRRTIIQEFEKENSLRGRLLIFLDMT